MKKQVHKLTPAQKANITRWYHDGQSVKEISDKTGVVCSIVIQRIAKTLRAECFRLWAKIVTCEGKCAICGSTKDINGHHLLEKGAFPHLALNLENGLSLCANHHMFDRAISAHNNSASIEAFRLWLKEHQSETYFWWDTNRHNKFMPDKALTGEKIIEIHKELSALAAMPGTLSSLQ